MVSQIKAQVPPSLNGERFDVAAAALCSEFSRKKIKLIIDRGGAYLNKKRILVAKKQVSEGDIIELFWEESRPLSGNSVKTIAVSILAEEADFIVINKPAGLPSQATLTSSEDTVIHALQVQYPEKFANSQLLLVHRLDKETSGVMLLAKSKAAQARFEKLFIERKMKKVYQALCFGVPRERQGVLRWPIRKDPSRPNTYVAVLNSGAPSAGGRGSSPGRKMPEIKSATTLYVVLKTFPQARVSWIECQPETGRTHQIRVHLQALGVPLLGDKTYAANVIGHPMAQLATRHMLHAVRLAWTQDDGSTFAFEAPFPHDFGACLNRLQEEGASHELQTHHGPNSGPKNLG
ncbi:RluA family pseudouridine synthase [bacterium]|nr:RluA family pseudouridine synthase [bacterium]